MKVTETSRRLIVLALLAASVGAGYLFARWQGQKETVEAMHFQIALGARQNLQILRALNDADVKAAKRVASEFLTSDMSLLEQYSSMVQPPRAGFYKQTISEIREVLGKTQ